MNTNNIKKYAPQARRAFISTVMKRLNELGIYSDNQIAECYQQGELLNIEGRHIDAAIKPLRDRLVAKVLTLGFLPLVEIVAYTWFNRLCAIRYMELHDYLGHGLRVLSHPKAPKTFEILEHAQDVAEELGLNRDHIIELKLAGNKEEELYRELLLGQCHQLHKAMPFLFEALDDETELLLSGNLTRTDSILRSLVDDIPEEDWHQVEVIGWLYQFYISEKKDQVIGKVVKSEDIPAATQLFTPNWIVKYMVQNSLGAQWLATYPDSPIKEQMEYHIEPAEQTDEVKAQLEAITPSTLDPEELTLIDPACGSGHILVEAYELFKDIYLERGYRQRDVAQLILEKNLFGLDIDERAAQLTGFALMMKARADDRRLFTRGIKLNVMALVDSTSFDPEPLVPLLHHSREGGNPENSLLKSDLDELKKLFEYATTFGSLIQVPKRLTGKLPALKQLSEMTSQDLFVSDALTRLAPLVQQAELLAAQYDAVVANPPYMGSKYQAPILKKFATDNFKDSKSDFFSMFIERMMAQTTTHGRVGIVAPFVWMFLPSYEKFREKIIDEMSLTSLIQLEYNAFEPAMIPVAALTFMRSHVANILGSYIKLSEFKGSQNQAPKVLEAIANHACGWFFETAQDEFKKIPGSPVAYWVSKQLRHIFVVNPLLGEITSAKQGLATADNNRFLRLWFEVSHAKVGYSCSDRKEADVSRKKWFPFNKGGDFRRWYGNQECLINWEKDGKELFAFRPHSVIRNPQYYFQESVSTSAITSKGTSYRYYSGGALFDVNFRSFFLSSSTVSKTILALLNSIVLPVLEQTLNPTLALNKNDLDRVPFKSLPDGSKIASKLINMSKLDWNSYERSWDFQTLPIIPVFSEFNSSLQSNYTAWITQNRDTIAEMKHLEEENNRLFINAYGLQDELTPDIPIKQITLTVNPAYRYGGKLTVEEQWTRFRQDSMAELVSYAIGCMMGRYSLDEPGLIYAHSGNADFDPDRYATFPADDDGIIPLTDTEWFSDDAVNRLIKFISVVWDKSLLEENLTFLADNLSPRKSESSRETIRRYLCNTFFKNHLKTYKKRPIYWLFSSGKQKAFQCLVYLHRYNEGTLARMRTEYVTPLLGKFDAYTDQLQHQVDDASSTAAANRYKKALVVLEKKQTELQEFDDKLKYYADRRIKLDLDDGVKANYGKFGDLLADVKAITGKKPEMG